jgi:hypothetical protein
MTKESAQPDTTKELSKSLDAFYQMTWGKRTPAQVAEEYRKAMIQVNQNRQREKRG